MNKTAVVIRHVAFEDLDSFGDVVAQAGYDIRRIDAAVTGAQELESLSADLVVLMGGPVSANDVSEYPFLDAEIRLLRHRINEDLPTLGICLGAQLLARALGARVYAGEDQEIGWYPLTLTDEGAATALRHLQRDDAPVFHWHGETFDIPDGATRLASSERFENQAFCYGGRILALQFHPEVSAAGLEQWYVGHTGEITRTPGISVRQLREDTRMHADGLVPRAQAFLCDWLAQVARES